MQFPEDYVNAHHRHWTDAELLFQNSCWANADQLYGLSAECGVKALMPSLNMPVAKKHLDAIWPDFAKAATSAHGRVNARYVALLPGGTPFVDWSVQNRYANTSCFPKSFVIPHRAAADKVHRMLTIAKQDGVL